MGSLRPAVVAATLDPRLRHNLTELGRVAAAVSGHDLALRLRPFHDASTVSEYGDSEPPKRTCSQRIRSFFEVTMNSTLLETVSIIVVLVNCITLTFYRPCIERKYCDALCVTWKLVDKISLGFFLFELFAKMLHQGPRKYFSDHWHYLDVLIVIFGMMDEFLHHFQINLASIRAMRILRPFRTIEWIPSVRMLVSLLFDTLPMLANVFLLSLFFFVVFGIMAVQLWAGVLRQRCYHSLNLTHFPTNFPGIDYLTEFPFYISPNKAEYLCTTDSGMHTCSHIPSSKSPGANAACSLSVEAALEEWQNALLAQNVSIVEGLNSTINSTTSTPLNYTAVTSTPATLGTTTVMLPILSDCINWNSAYNVCRGGLNSPNPFDGAVSFDNVLMAWMSIFQVVTLEGWSDIMYYLQDVHTFWVFLYFVPLILFGSYFLVNLCLACITIQLARSKYIHHTKSASQSGPSISSAASIAVALVKYSTMAAVRHHISQACCKVYDVLLRRALGGSSYSSDDVASLTQPVKNNPDVKAFVAASARRPLASARSFSFATLPEKRRFLANFRQRPFVSTSSYSFDNSSTLPKIQNTSVDSSYITMPSDAERQSLLGDSDCFLDSFESSDDIMQSASETFPENLVNIQVHHQSTHDPKQTRRPSFMLTRQNAVSINDIDTDAVITGKRAKLMNPLAFSFDDQIESVHGYVYTAKAPEPISLVDRVRRSAVWRRWGGYRAEKLWAVCKPFLVHWRAQLTRLLRHPVSDYFFMYCISVNTVCLAVEHHDQPRVLSITLNSVNVLFTLIFALELIAKVICFGLSYYTSNALNAIDALVVFFTLADVFGDATFTVFRAFRLVRLLKLMDFMPTLRNTLASLFRVVDSALTFMIFLFICMYIFALFGTFLLGGRLCETELGETCMCGEPPEGMAVCKCNRKNFDSFLQSMLSVFQIFTQESWNELLYESMTKVSPWVAVYYILLVIVGNFVLLNLLIAILVSGFLERAMEVNPESSLLVPERSRAPSMVGSHEKAQTPSKSSQLGKVPNNELRHRSLSFPGSSTPKRGRLTQKGGSLDSALMYTQQRPSQDQTTPPRVSVLSTSKSSPSSISTSTSSSIYISVAEFTSPSLTPNISHRPVVLLSNDFRSTINSSAVSEQPLSFRDSQSQDLAEELLKAQQNVSEDTPMDTRILCRQLFSIILKHVRSEMKARADYAFYFLSPRNLVRRVARRVVDNSFFEWVIFVLIAGNCVAVAIENPNIDPNSTLRTGLNIINNLLTVLFTVEMVLKMIAFGVFANPDAYLRSGWNILDCILAVVCCSEILISHFLKGSNTQLLSTLRVLRMLRALRPLRVINSSRSLRLIVETVFSSLNEIGTVVIICFFFFFIYAIFGVQQFHGCLGRCRGDNVTHIRTRIECLLAGNRWQNDFYNYDNVFVALQTLFVFATFDNWVAIMFSAVDCVGIDQQPQENHNPWRMFYFLSFITFCGFFLLNIFVGVVVSNFQKNFDKMKAVDAAKAKAMAGLLAVGATTTVKDDKNMTVSEMMLRPSHKLWLSRYAMAGSRQDRQGRCIDSCPLKTNEEINNLASGFVILLNVLLMSLEHYNMSTAMDRFVNIASYVFTGLFTVEMCLRLAALGCRRYVKEGWNIFDSIVVVTSLAGTIFEEMSRHELPLNATLVRVMRIAKFARVLKVLRVANTMHRIIDTVGKSLLQVGHLSLLIVLVFFIYAALGVELFGRLDYVTSHDSDCIPGQFKCHVLGEHANFANMGIAMLTLFRVLTGDNWSGLLKDIVQLPCDPSPQCTPAPILSQRYKTDHANFINKENSTNLQMSSFHRQGTTELIPLGEHGEPLYCCVPALLPAAFFISFVLVTTLCLLNLVVAVIMGTLEDSYEYQDDEERNTELTILAKARPTATSTTNTTTTKNY